MTLRDEYMAWLCQCELEQCETSGTGDGVRYESADAIALVNLYDFDEQTTVEMRINKRSDDEAIFFLHFELVDLYRAKQLFAEMQEALYKYLNREITHVLLCCTCGMTTTFFANKLNETASVLGLDYDFAAKPVPEAMEIGESYAAVMLAPQVAHQRDELADALPTTLVIEMPARIFGSYDASAALRLVVDELAGSNGASDGSISMETELGKTSRILSISHVTRQERESTLSYRIFDHGRVTLSGQIVRRHLSPQSVIDLVNKLEESGWSTKDFDAIGIALPKRICKGTLYDDGPDGTREEFGLQDRLRELWGTSVFLHSAGTAAASGCYAQQDEYQNVAFHAQPLGDVRCTEGFILDGHPYYGRGGLSGSLGILGPSMALSMDVHDAAWRYDGVQELVAHYLAMAACTIGPDIVYVWCDLIPDVDALNKELAKLLPADALPKLVAVSGTGYEDLVLVGETALCLYELQASKQDTRVA